MNEEYLPCWDPENPIKIVEREGTVSVVVGNRLYMKWNSGDEESRRMAIVQLHKCGFGSQEKLAEVFDMNSNTVKKYIRKFSRVGAAGIIAQRRGPRGSWKLTPMLRSKILTVVMREGVRELEAVQKWLREVWHEEVSLPSIRQVMAENGLFKEFKADSDFVAIQEMLFDGDDAKQLDLVFDHQTYNDDKNSSIISEDVQTDKEESMQPKPMAVTDVKRKRNYSTAQRIYLDRLDLKQA